MGLTYTTGQSSDVRGCCGHHHRTVDSALACMDRDTEICQRQGGYSDRSRVVRSDGRWNTRVGLETGGDWRIA